ncbi:MAG: DUF1353 domain-containing protein [Proteobacteria bacterium]|nr:DUF1353 domain-containing protein [Pseudomonadota bacterium]
MRRASRIACWLLLIALGVPLFAPAPALAEARFVGVLKLVPSGCAATGKCLLDENFGFIDGRGVEWQARKGLETDGASIPPWAQPFVGAPFDEAFIRAAVIHDHYCIRQVREWRVTHLAFYEGLRASGVPEGKASLMYYAVLVGGPKWIELMPGAPCGSGGTCINQVDVSAQVRGSFIAMNGEGQALVRRPALYGTPGFSAALERFQAEHAANPAGPTREQAEAAAARDMSGDFFFRNGRSIGTSLRLRIEVR